MTTVRYKANYLEHSSAPFLVSASSMVYIWEIPGEHTALQLQRQVRLGGYGSICFKAESKTS